MIFPRRSGRLIGSLIKRNGAFTTLFIKFSHNICSHILKVYSPHHVEHFLMSLPSAVYTRQGKPDTTKPRNRRAENKRSIG